MNKLTKAERAVFAQLLNGAWVYSYDHRDGERGFMYSSNLVKCTAAGRGLIACGLCIEQNSRLVIAPTVISSVFEMRDVLHEIVVSHTLGRLHSPNDHSYIKDERACKRCKVSRRAWTVLRALPL